MVRVGDIVKTKNKEGKVVAAAVTKINMKRSYCSNSAEGIESVEVLFDDGTHGHRSDKSFTETYHHIDMQGVLDSIK